MESISVSNQSKAYLFLVITTSAWGSLYVVSKYIMAYVPPLTVLMFRYLIAGAVLFALLKTGKFNSAGSVKIERGDYKYILLAGMLGYFGSIGAQLMGTKLTNAGLASLLNSTNPIFMLIFAIPILKEKITLTKVVSIVAALAGVYIILGGGDASGMLGGALLSIASVIAWSLTSVSLKRFMRKYNPLAVTTYAILVAFVCTLPFSAYELITTPGVDIFRPDVLLGLLYVGVVCTAMTNVLWNASLSMIEAGRCALFYPIQPLVATILGSIFLHEPVHLTFVLGAALIIGGVLFSVISERIKAKRAENRA